MLSGKWRNITDIPKHKLLQYRQTEQRFVFSNDDMFLFKNIIIRPLLQNFIVSYNAVQIVVVMCFPYDLHSLYKLL
jgi:hypothetical protein